MIKNENIICISSIDWDFIWQGHQEIMSSLAKNGNRVLFIENTGVRVPGIRDLARIWHRIQNWLSGINGIRKAADNLFIFSPLILPFPYLRIAQWVNRRLMLSILDKWIKVMDFPDPVIWVFLPTPLSLDIINNLNYKAVVYYCIDNFRVSSNAAKKIKNSEIKLLKKSDLVFVTSRELYNYALQYNSKVYFFPFAVDFPKFEKVRLEKDAPPGELKGIKKPIIGYVGGVHKWMDLELIKEAALKYPDYSFIFAGPIQTDVSQVSGLENIYFLGKKEHGEIPYLVKNFDACMVPYLIADYTASVYPTKLNEYLAMGKPVISTDLPEVRSYNKENNNIVLVGSSREDFISLIPQALSLSSASAIEKRISAAKMNSWQQRIEQMTSLIKSTIEHKSKADIDWKDRVFKFYKTTRKKTAKFILACLILYLLISYTNIIWFLAKPLKISQAPKNADCIVVFAGGVGESGRVGEGYQERVKYAVELYKKGYAKNIIFSSGYQYVFKEAMMMKTLAVSLGVPEGAVILEDRAINNYQNVKFSSDIAKKNNWKSVLLVSSPYNMLRSELIVRKIAGGLEVNYLPIPNSMFYAHPERNEAGKKIWRRVSFLQIKGILHEYLAIAYYRLEGYI